MVRPLTLEDILNCGIDYDTAIGNGEVPALLSQINSLSSLPAVECWQQLTRSVLKPAHPFRLHHLLYETVFSDWDSHQGPAPAWVPSDEQIQATHIAQLLRQLHLTAYSDLHAWSVQHRSEFWDWMIRRLEIRFRQPYTALVDLSQGVEFPQWLVDARLNIVESCFQAPQDAPAIVFQAPGDSLSTWTYAELRALTNRVANGFVDRGLHPGDAIAIDMPMTAESVAIYLGIIQAGGVVVSIADSFAPDAIAARLAIAQAKAIVTQDVIVRGDKTLPLYSKVVAANAPTAIVLQSSPSPINLRSGDLSWEAFLSPNDSFDAVPALASAHINLLFSSGTTGTPKAIPWTQTTPIKCAVDAHLHHDLHPGDIAAWPTNLGWMMGPWLIYASLINQATLALYYGAPTERSFGQFVQDARVTMLGVVPSLVSTWKTTDCMHGLDWSAINAFSSTGECSNPQDMLFLMSLAGYKPIVEYCGGTEIGGGYITGTLVQPCAPSTFTTPALGLDIIILDADGQPTPNGEAFIVPPSIGLSTELLTQNHHDIYFASTPPHPSRLTSHSSPPPPLRRHGDQLERLPNGYYRAHGRVDDTMNLNGIKVSSAEIERVLNRVDGVCETAAIAIAPQAGGPNQLVIYAVVTSEFQSQPDALKLALKAALKHDLNPLFKIDHVAIVASLPRTASNKVMRRVLRDQLNNQIV